jgi:hypothetical protein
MLHSSIYSFHGFALKPQSTATTLNSTFMTGTQIATLCLVEAIGLFLIGRLWLRPRKMSVPARLVWSAVLLIPLFGVIIYGFLRAKPDEHPYDTDTTSGAAESQSQGGSDGHY